MGTCSLHDSNELSVLQYSEDANHFDITSVYSHPDQIWAIEASPKDTSLVVTSRQTQSCSKALTIWKMPNQTAEDMDDDEAGAAVYNQDQPELTEVASFNQSMKPSTVRSMRWHKRDDTILTLDSKLLSVWSISEGKVSVSLSICVYFVWGGKEFEISYYPSCDIVIYEYICPIAS